jgi:hypothetical protein
MGGYLAKPADYYPHIFSPDGIFGTYPFLLPNLVCVVAIVVAVAQGMIFLKETNPYNAIREQQKKAAEWRDRRAASERTPLITGGRKKDPSTNVRETEGSESDSSGKPSPASYLLVEDGLPSATDPHFDLRRSSFGTMHSIIIDGRRPSAHRPSTTEPIVPDTTKPDLRTTFNFTVVMLIISLILVSYHSMGYFNMLPIYLLDKPWKYLHNGQLDLHGGLGYDLHAVGGFMAVNGVISVFVQGVVFPIFVGKVGVWRSFAIMVGLYPLTYPLVPLLTLLPFGPARSAGIYATMVIQNHLNIIIPPCALILIKNATPSPLVLGTVNGACMSLLSLARTIAPPLEGIIYAKGGSAAAWYSLCIITVAGAIQFWWIPREPPNSVWIKPPLSRVEEEDEEAVEDGASVFTR